MPHARRAPSNHENDVTSYGLMSHFTKDFEHETRNTEHGMFYINWLLITGN